MRVGILTASGDHVDVSPFTILNAVGAVLIAVISLCGTSNGFCQANTIALATAPYSSHSLNHALAT